MVMTCWCFFVVQDLNVGESFVPVDPPPKQELNKSTMQGKKGSMKNGCISNRWLVVPFLISRHFPLNRDYGSKKQLNQKNSATSMCEIWNIMSNTTNLQLCDRHSHESWFIMAPYAKSQHPTWEWRGEASHRPSTEIVPRVHQHCQVSTQQFPQGIYINIC